MGSRYDEGERDACPYSDLDEYLCEYVDGEMDPSVRASFEEYLRRDEGLAEHVESLRRTREMLCAYSHRGPEVSCGAGARLRNRLSHEIMVSEGPLLGGLARHLGVMVGASSVVLLLFAAGLMFLVPVPPDAASAITPLERSVAGRPLVFSSSFGPSGQAGATDFASALRWSPNAPSAPDWLRRSVHAVADSHAAVLKLPVSLPAALMEP